MNLKWAEDLAREWRISFYRQQMVDINEDRAYWFALMKREIEQRSAEQVARMEQAQGLAQGATNGR